MESRLVKKENNGVQEKVDCSENKRWNRFIQIYDDPQTLNYLRFLWGMVMDLINTRRSYPTDNRARLQSPPKSFSHERRRNQS